MNSNIILMHCNNETTAYELGGQRPTETNWKVYYSMIYSTADAVAIISNCNSRFC